MKLTLAHDYLIQMGGAERVVASMVRRHPKSFLYTSAVRWRTMFPEFQAATIQTSWMQRLPAIGSQFKKYFALYPSAFQSFGVVDSDVLWVSASTFAKCLQFTPRTTSVLYCHNPTRFLWQVDEYVDTEVRSQIANRVVRRMLPWLRQSDYDAVQRFDVVIANSENVRRRIAKCYRRDATVIHPPVSVDRFVPCAEHDDYYLVVCRLVAHKAIERAVVACSESQRRLVVVGDGPDRTRLEAMAGPTVNFTGHVSDAEVEHLLQRSRALIFPGTDDFGIVAVEAQACGKPVIAYAGGGGLETVIEGRTGCFFHEPNANALIEAINRFEMTTWNPLIIRENAERFGEDRFHQQTDALIEQAREAKARAGAIRQSAARTA